MIGLAQIERFRPATVAGGFHTGAPRGDGVLVDNTLVRLRKGLACAVGAGFVVPTPIGRVELNWVAPMRPTRDEAADAMASGRWQALYARPATGRFQLHFNPTLS